LLLNLILRLLEQAGTSLIRAVRHIAAPWLARSWRKNEVKQLKINQLFCAEEGQE